MFRPRVLSLAAIAAGLLTFAPSAAATITVSSSGDTVFVTGDAGAQHIQFQDGNLAAPEPYAFVFYSETNETVERDSGSTCTSDFGSPFESISCGNASVDKVVFNLGAGSDTLGWYGDTVFDDLAAMTTDLGAGGDQNESGIQGIPTIVRGGDGDDDVGGHDGPTSVVEGGPGNDRVIGADRTTGETLRGGSGNDQVEGRGGNDQIFGDEGNDSLVGQEGGDTITGGPGQDNVEADGVPNAFSGNDTLLLQDGERDSAACGFGADTVVGDSIDLLPLQDCESVTLAGGGPPPPPPGPPAPPSNAKVALAKPGKLSARKRRIAVEVSCPSDAGGGCQGQVRFTASFTERGKPRRLSLGRVSFTLQPGASKTVGRKLSKKIVRRLRKAKKRKLIVRAVSRDAAFKEFKSSRTAALKFGR